MTVFQDQTAALHFRVISPRLEDPRRYFELMTMNTGLPREARKPTLSCSRCRASKLKCDQKEPCVG